MTAEITGKRRGITGTRLKIIAMVAMFIDHFSAILLDGYLSKVLPTDAEALETFFRDNPATDFIYLLMIVMRLIGRFGFPIFAFLIVEGFQHTRDVKKYALNLAIFALISELPFNLGFAGKLLAPHYQNVFLTLLFGLLCIASISYLQEKQQTQKRWKPLFYLSALVAGPFAYYMIRQCFLYQGLKEGVFAYLKSNQEVLDRLKQALDFGIDMELTTKLFLACMVVIGILSFVVILIVAAVKKWDVAQMNSFSFLILPLTVFCALGDLLSTDYGSCGVLVIAVIYLLRQNKENAFMWGCIVLTLMSFVEITAFFMMIPISKYNGERGRKINKYIFYAFYPVHIAVLYFIGLLIGFVSFSIK